MGGAIRFTNGGTISEKGPPFHQNGHHFIRGPQGMKRINPGQGSILGPKTSQVTGFVSRECVSFHQGCVGCNETNRSAEKEGRMARVRPARMAVLPRFSSRTRSAGAAGPFVVSSWGNPPTVVLGLTATQPCPASNSKQPYGSGRAGRTRLTQPFGVSIVPPLFRHRGYIGGNTA
jgi:hypothetical protein